MHLDLCHDVSPIPGLLRTSGEIAAQNHLRAPVGCTRHRSKVHVLEQSDGLPLKYLNRIRICHIVLDENNPIPQLRVGDNV